MILLFRSSTATANFLFPHFCVEGRERERRTWSRINRYRFRLFEPVASVSIPRFCTLRARSRPGNEKCHLSLQAAAAAFLARGLFVHSRVTAAYEREETKKWKEADVPPRPLPVRISGHQLRLAANFRSIIAMREDDSPNHSPTDDPPNSSRINKFEPPRSSR